MITGFDSDDLHSVGPAISDHDGDETPQELHDRVHGPVIKWAQEQVEHGNALDQLPPEFQMATGCLANLICSNDPGAIMGRPEDDPTWQFYRTLIATGAALAMSMQSGQVNVRRRRKGQS